MRANRRSPPMSIFLFMLLFCWPLLSACHELQQLRFMPLGGALVVTLLINVSFGVSNWPRDQLITINSLVLFLEFATPYRSVLQNRNTCWPDLPPSVDPISGLRFSLDLGAIYFMTRSDRPSFTGLSGVLYPPINSLQSSVTPPPTSS